MTDDGKVVFGYPPGKIEAMMKNTRLFRDALEAHHQALEGINK